MMRLLANLKDQVVKAYDYILELEKMPLRAFQDDDFGDGPDTKKVPKAKRQNKVKVEDLRPKRPAEMNEGKK
jgi:hypothetical protein